MRKCIMAAEISLYCDDEPSGGRFKLSAPPRGFPRMRGATLKLECATGYKPKSGENFVEVTCEAKTPSDGEWRTNDF